MLSKFSPALVVFFGSVALLAGLVGSLYWISRPQFGAGNAEPLEIHCAAAMFQVVETIAQEYTTTYGQQVVIHAGPSQVILKHLEEAKKADLFLPADDSFIRQADNKGLLGEVKNVASMSAVVIVRPKLGKEIKTWNDFLAAGQKIGLANTDTTAIGRLTRQTLQGQGLWQDLEAVKPTYLGDVNEVGNSVAVVGATDVGITWDALAKVLVEKNPDVKIVRLKELDHAKARVQIALAKNTKQRDHANRFIAFLRAKDKGAIHLKKAGYSDVDEAEAMDAKRELVIYAGAMLRPALEEALTEFENREKCRIIRVYNGCGILVNQMQVGEMPDIYFACDTSFMDKVKDKFDGVKNISSNQLMIVVRKGNPKKIYELEDLARPGLRVGIGHEQQCALGSLTKETFDRTGTYGKIARNIAVQSPTGDFLVNQLFASGEKGLDVVIAYRSNIQPYPDKVDGIPIPTKIDGNDIKCAQPAQPIAVAKSSKYPELSRRLMEFLQERESRDRFERLGFGWEVKEVEK